MLDSTKILIAKIQAHQGLNGWLKVYSYSETKEKLSNYNYFFLLKDDHYICLEVEKFLIEKTVKLKFKNFNNREDTKEFIGQNLYIEDSQLETLNSGEFYWKDLIGLDVYLNNSSKIGIVSDIIETGSNDVLVVKGKKEYLIPYIFGESIKEIKLEEKKIVIDELYYEQ